MVIERIDVYRVRVPLAFVWRTSYGDQLHTDTLLVRMEGGGQHACRVINIKMARVGGLEASRRIQALCAEHAIPCWVGGMLETAVGGAICAELAALPNFTYAGDIFPSSYFCENDLGKPELVVERGTIATSRVPGIAQEPDPDLLARWTVDRATFHA